MLLLEPLAQGRQDLESQTKEQGAAAKGGNLLIASPGSKATHEHTSLEMVRSRHFRILMANVFFNAQVVLIMTASQKTFGLELLPGISDSSLTNMAGAASLMNGIGRLSLGVLADYTSFRFAMVSLCLTQAGLLATFPLCTSPVVYCIWLCGIFCTIGGNFALFPLATSTFFGSENMGSNYGFVFLGVAVSELLASAVLQLVLDGRSMAVACETMAIMAGCGAIAASQMVQDTSSCSQGPEAKLAMQPSRSGYGSVAWEITKLK